ncbi:MAG TPA: hypothetical protein VMD29_02300 [Terracidiphilus sp.]|jgi:hypothetical protein|nr:hypothetical protein [Terracidiphilus sp.]
MAITTKPEFRAPADVLSQEIERLGLPKNYVVNAVALTPLLGTWVNCDHTTRGLVRLMIAASGKEITVHGFGACSPTPCDWGVVNGMVYAPNVTATAAIAFNAVYNFGFKQTTIVGHLMYGALLVETFDHFTDSSGRADYYSLDILTQ